MMNFTNFDRHRVSNSFPRKLQFSIFAVAFAMSVAAVQSVTADYERGVQAWESGNVLEAISEWRTAADAGDGRAMLAVGRAYRQGLGVLQDFVEAYKWFNLAASRGMIEAVKERDEMAAEMTESEQSEARDLAKQWRPSVGTASSTVSVADEASVVVESPEPPREAIREAQALLNVLGYRPGPADGVWGKKSVTAYRSFLRESGLPDGEVLTLPALLAMRDIAERQGVEPDSGAAASSSTSLPSDALHRAAMNGDIAALEAAISAGVDVDQLDRKGWTALMHAVNASNVLIVESLTEAGANVDVRAPDGATALFMAAVLGDSPAIAQLMKAGADVSVPGPKGKTVAEVAKVVFGEASDARAQGLDDAVLGLLEGRFQDCDICPVMVVVPAGEFMMGSPESEKGRSHREGPVHRVEIRQEFAVGKYEITFLQWDACVSGGGCSHRPDDVNWGRGDRPVISVNWKDAKEYVGWLSRITGERYRLLSESEWEYVARAGTTGPFHFGSTISTHQANYGRNLGRTSPVGSYPENAFGLHDVHGNVWEWVEDCWHDSYDGAPSNGSAWTSSGDCSQRVLRGGSWDDWPWDLRSANRGGDSDRFWAGTRVGYNGFRVARVLTP